MIEATIGGFTADGKPYILGTDAAEHYARLTKVVPKGWHLLHLHEVGQKISIRPSIFKKSLIGTIKSIDKDTGEVTMVFESGLKGM